MDNNYFLFDFQNILAQQKEKHTDEEKFDRLMEGADENSVIEEMFRTIP